MILEIDNVELYFQSKRILNGIYLKSELNSVTGILGSNGSGKSSLINIIFGNLTPKYKLVRLNRKPILKPLYKTKKVKFLPQHPFLPRIKLNKIFNLYNIDWKTFTKEFEGFDKYRNTLATKLSGGELRVIETYLVLKSKSEIVLLDEPFSHLAPLYIEKFKSIISEEKRKKVIIITDHMYRHILDVSDEIYLLKNGCTKKIEHIEELEDYKYLNLGSLT
jgi:ABC-type multidrug transport system ATPase subunit